MTHKPRNPHIPASITFMMIAMVSMHALPVSAATFPVGDQLDLVDAINESNINASNNVIVFTGNIVLTSALPVIDTGDAALTIVGDGFTLSRDPESEDEFRILRIYGGIVGIENLTISGGISNEWISKYEPRGGGGIFVQNSDLTLAGCTISGNSAFGGGGVWIDGGSTVTMTRCTISDNLAEGFGGGIMTIRPEDTDPTAVTLIECSITGNAVTGEDQIGGGGILTAGEVEVLVLGCILSGNTAQMGGGITAFVSENITLINSTFSGNSAQKGGGITTLFGAVTAVNCTVTENTAEEGGGIHNRDGNVTLLSSLIAGNEADTGSEVFHYIEEGEFGAILSDGSNVLGHSGLTHASAFVNFTPGSSDLVCTSNGATPTALGNILNPTLAKNGGPTRTHALVAGSPAIDLVTTGPATDQRGVARPQGEAYDAGAFEFVCGSSEPTAQYEEYWHQVTANTVNPNHWNLDPSGILGDHPKHSIASGTLPRGLALSGILLAGRFADLGTHAFTIVSRSGNHEVRNHFYIQVIPPTLTPLIVGLWVNGDYLPAVIIQDRTHGDAAVSELVNLTVPAGNPLDMRFNWDYIKGDSSWRIIRGNLPQGLVLRELVEDGKPVATISGTPTQTGEFILVVSVLDWRGRGYQWIRLVVE